MTKRFFTMLMVSAAVMSLILSGCGSGGGAVSSGSNTSQTVQGVAASGAPIVGTVTLNYNSTPPRVMTTASASDGSFAFNVGGLTPPYTLSVSWTDSSGTNQLYSFANGPGTANINPFSNAVFAASAGVPDIATFAGNPTSAMIHAMMSGLALTDGALRTELSPLFQRYGTSQDPVSDAYLANHTGIDAMFDDVIITVSNGMINVTNRQTGAVIFTCPEGNIPSGTFNNANMPGGTGTIDGAALYASNCSICHQTLATSTVLGATAAQIQAAIKSVGSMSTLSSLSALQIQAIASTLSSTPSTTTTPPAACTYTYNVWGACQSNNTQTRNVLTTSPSGCTGTPLTSQACVYTPPTPTACTYTYNTSSPCLSNNTQAITVATALPAGCTGTPATSQACVYTPPTPTACTYTYNAWGACQSNSTQTRTVATSTPTGCTGTPLLSQACVYMPPVSTLTLAQVQTTCTACHGLTVNTTVLASGGYTVTGRTAATWLTTVNTMMGHGASLAPGTTAQDYANFLATLP